MNYLGSHKLVLHNLNQHLIMLTFYSKHRDNQLFINHNRMMNMMCMFSYFDKVFFDSYILCRSSKENAESSSRTYSFTSSSEHHYSHQKKSKILNSPCVSNIYVYFNRICVFRNKKY
jgi:hypothetical protein